ncbi:chaperone for protein-folding within the ER, fungal-domain-containing protein [Leucosporidium creatinivorum]|uniref:Chaperone for protein-folding within the ER, fungal-domain-containing protein n=1 Tax=Leucosporidium creatinivorum TaxID=106004 RepID=A0A1Y2F619_9BASI|nr:chaperone for protein-folding within the ER, fungal-domain-containing protein [Leucosporidium creatinivorum]
MLSLPSLFQAGALVLSFAASLSQGASTDVVGTWSTGSGAVLTGTAFGNPVNNTFDYPPVAGYSYSFTEDGWYEEASFTWTSNATDHHCIQANIIWQHGTYKVNANGTITTDSTMFAGDGRVQVQNACAAQSSAIYYYQENNLFATWAVSTWRGKTMLRLGSYDGSLLPRMYKISDTPRDYMFDSLYLSNHTDSSTTRRR